MLIKYRVHEVAKDLNVPSKEVISLLKKHFGDTKKHMTALTEEELDVVFDFYTQQNAIENFDSYFAVRDRAIEKHIEEKEQKKQREQTKEKAKEEQRGVKPQPNKKASAQQKQQKAVQKSQNTNHDVPMKGKRDKKIIDTRAAVVDVERYNEKYDRLASEKIKTENTVRKQKITQRSQQRGKPRNSRKETEAERLKRIAAERKSKPITVTIPDEITVSELALRLKATAAEVIKKLFLMGTMVTVNDVIDFDTASLAAMEFHAKVEKEVVVTIEERIIDDSEDDDENLVPRAPVVVVMGHVDHGKTSLLDTIRHTNVTQSEAGGITQHIGAYRVKINDRDITFLDTPGHEAFTTMRARGAQVTDIAILVVAADDGIMPQTIEAINHAKAAGVSVIVAINKIDKEGANPELVKQQLTEYELVPEEWGGDTPCIPVSAKTKQGIEDLLEMVILVADMKELKANPDRAAKGTVIEARLDKGRGTVATMLVQNGTLHVGDTIVAGTAVGRVRAMTNDKGEKVESAGPSYPVEITGLDDVPSGGDIFNAVSDERLARELVEQRKAQQKEEQFSRQTRVTLDNLFDQMQLGDVKELKLIVKADVQGSVEAVRQSLEKLSNDEVRVHVIHGGVGAISESDVMLANASNAIIVGFNVRPDPVAAENAETEGVDMRLYRVIYDCIEEIEAAMKGLLAPKTREVQLGRAECRNVIKVKNVGFIAGSYVLSGKVARNANVRVVRDGVVIAEDRVVSLQRFKDAVKEVAAGYECGIGLEHFNDLKEGDIFEAYVIEEYTE
ncbi:MAG TPA: translation initiation factor IF-2 [Candidatus Scatavimonas merdigallinarum]|uniref:Translation initiation factor IF-2 n=1 Tax=Candidatus Scatavimonas merdigallinarum TaxID=2840914 RepID=A0A9D1CUE5_9FIRM|nr:translation initiation factor IF-2 [Candidatus Scatavimonas merdigallinarum]